MGLVFFESSLALGEVQALASDLHGDLAVVSGLRYALAFDGADSENLAVRALLAARVLTSRGAALQARVDVQAVTVQRRADGTRRYLGAALLKKTAWPQPGGPAVELTEVAQRLSREAEGLTPTLLSARDGGGAPGSDVPFLGQAPLLARLDAVAEGARQGRGAVVRVIAEPGLGRTRLARELQARFAAAGFKVVPLKARESAPGRQGALVVELVTALLGAAEPELARAGLARQLGPAAEPAWKALQLVMGWLTTDAADALVLAVPPAALRASTAQALGELLRAQAQGAPVLVTLDDAHLADDRVLDALEYATLAGEPRPLLAVLLGRPALAAARPALGARAGQRELVELEPLREADAATLCRHLLLPAEPIADQVVHRLTERAGRNPQLLAELIHGLREEGLLVRRSTGAGYAVVSEVIDRVPNLPLVEWTARRELAHLSGELRGHARLAAVAGPASLAQHVGAVNALEALGHRALVPLDARFALARLLERQVLQSGRDGVLRFRLPLVKGLLLSEGRGDELEVMHRAALAFFKGDPTTVGVARAARLARHAEGSGETTVAAAHWLEAGLEGARRQADVDSDQSLSRALALLPEGDVRALSALRARGIVRYRLARYADARVDFEAAHREAQRLGDRAAEIDVLLWWATALDWMSDFAGARTHIEAARALYDATPVPQLAATLAFNEGRLAGRFDNFAVATQKLREALALIDQAPEGQEETRIEALVLLLYMLPLEGRLDEAEALLAELRARCAAVGDRFHEGAALLNTRTLWLERGDLERGVASQQEAARIGRELGEQLLEYAAGCNVAELLLLSGETARAVEAARAAIELEARSGEVAGGPYAHLIGARVALAADDLEGAAREVTLIDAMLSNDAEGLLPNEKLLLELVKLGLRRAASPAFQALLERARDAGFKDEVGEVATVWAATHPEARLEIRALLPPQLLARLAQRLEQPLLK